MCNSLIYEVFLYSITKKALFTKSFSYFLSETDRQEKCVAGTFYRKARICLSEMLGFLLVLSEASTEKNVSQCPKPQARMSVLKRSNRRAGMVPPHSGGERGGLASKIFHAGKNFTILKPMSERLFIVYPPRHPQINIF